MPNELFNISWFSVFIVIILIAFIANIIIILAILRDKSMHTSTYFYIINVNIADILIALSCLPERIAEVFQPNSGFHLGMFTCYLLPFLQQVSMHAALGFLLILTVHRCYPAGVPRCLQRNVIRRQIRNHSRTLCVIWAFAILINVPLFFITKYEKNILVTDNTTNLSYLIYMPTCETEATKIWSRTYIILLLVLTYLITGFFLIIIYGQAIRIILNSKKYTNPVHRDNDEQFHYLSPNINNLNKFREGPARSSTSSSPANSLNRCHQQNPRVPIAQSLAMPTGRNKCSSNSHSTQHLQVIIMLFVVILLYILLLLPYRLLNLVYILYNQLFQSYLMDVILFPWLLNTVRLLVFLNCALQPIIYLIISSRLRQTVIKLFQTCSHNYGCHCRCSLSSQSLQLRRNDQQFAVTNLCQPYGNLCNQPKRQQKLNGRDKELLEKNFRKSFPLTRSPITTLQSASKSAHKTKLKTLPRN